ncbi:unnamed protein product [marine sediment metagenome]|uniref:Uncharacterized protein n=1 Tax=marine sediment metagenome TaxID=412755 RepID=X1CPF2_9ZZZZ
MCEQSEVCYHGSVDRRTRDMLQQELSARGVSFEHYFCEKPGDKVNTFIFPWDFIFIRTSKKYLHNLYKKSLERMSIGKNPKHKEGFIAKHGACYNGCDGCVK